MQPPRLQLLLSLSKPSLALLAAALVAAPSFAADTILTVRADQGAAGIENALSSARKMRQSGQALSGPIRIMLEPGEYTLSAPLRLGPEDAGTEAAPLVIESRQPGAAVIVGAQRLSSPASDKGRWSFKPPGALTPEDERSGGQFYVNGRRGTLAREPNVGSQWLLSGGDGASLNTRPEDIKRIAQVIGDDKNRALVHLMQSWTSGLHHVAGIDSTKQQLTLDPKPRWGFLKYGPRQRFYVENVLGALDAPGEWIADAGSLLYLPTEQDKGIDPKKVAAYWPRLPQLLLVQGTAATPVDYLVLRGLSFQYSGVPTPAGGWIDNQAATDIPAAIEVNHARHLSVDHCDLRHLGGYGLWLRQGVRDSAVRDSLFTDLGAGAVRVGIEKTPSAADRSGTTAIERNVVSQTGRDFPGAVAIWIGRSFGNRIVDNLVAHTSYTGISLGWSWGFEDPSSGDNLVEGNVLFDIGQRQLSDLGAIYTLGRSPGTVIRSNFIREVRDFDGYGAGAWGIYNDEGSSDILVENNVVVGTRSGGYQLHYGRDLVVRDNLLAQGGGPEVRWANVKRSGSWRFENNGVEQRPGKGLLQFHNSTGSGDPDTLRDLQAGKGSEAVKVDARPGLADVRIDSSDDEKLALWRRTVTRAAGVVSRARKAGLADAELSLPPANR